MILILVLIGVNVCVDAVLHGAHIVMGCVDAVLHTL